VRRVLVALVLLIGTVALAGCGDDDLALCRDCPTATPDATPTPTVTATPSGP